MIYKRDLVDAINGLSHDLLALSIKVHDLESGLTKANNKIAKLDSNKCPCKDRKNILDEEVRKAAQRKAAKKQPRSKDGKFAKKK